jgi:hypothetical protein
VSPLRAQRPPAGPHRLIRTRALAVSFFLSAPALAAPRVTTFECRIGDGRGILPARADEDVADDELACHATVSDLGGRGAADLVAELRVLPPGGGFRTVASTALRPAGLRARTPELFLAHSAWATAIDWRRGPRLHLVLCVLDRPAPTARTWRIVARSRLVITRKR